MSRIPIALRCIVILALVAGLALYRSDLALAQQGTPPQNVPTGDQDKRCTLGEAAGAPLRITSSVYCASCTAVPESAKDVPVKVPEAVCEDPGAAATTEPENPLCEGDNESSDAGASPAPGGGGSLDPENGAFMCTILLPMGGDRGAT